MGVGCGGHFPRAFTAIKMLTRPVAKRSPSETSNPPSRTCRTFWTLTPFFFLLVVVAVVCVVVSGDANVPRQTIRGGDTSTDTASSSSSSISSSSNSNNNNNNKFATTTNPHKAGKGEDLNIQLESPVKVVSRSSFSGLLDKAKAHPRKRKMTDLTMNPEKNSLQILVNTWTEGSYSPVHMHPAYSEAFVILDGELAFFTFTTDGAATCHILSADKTPAIIVEAGQFHAMTAAPASLGYRGHAVVFENSGHVYDPKTSSKALAPFAPSLNDGLDGDQEYFKKILEKCPAK